MLTFNMYTLEQIFSHTYKQNVEVCILLKGTSYANGESKHKRKTVEMENRKCDLFTLHMYIH